MAALAALVLFSCTKNEVVELTVSPMAVNFEVAGGEQSVAITCNDHWTASVAADWLTLSPASADGNGTLKITATENKSIDAREAEVSVVAGEVKRTVKVAQMGKQAVLTVEPKAVSATVEGGAFDVTVTSNVEWTVTIPEAAASWLSVDKASAEGNAVVKLTVAANEGFDAREADVTVAGGKLTQVVKVAQVGLEPVLMVGPVAVETDDKGEVVDLTITSNLPWTVTIPEDAAWITADKVSGEGNAVVKITVAANETVNPRESKLTVAGGEFTIEIPVTQKGQDPKLALDITSKEVACAGEAFQVAVSSNVGWTVFTPVEATWLKVEPASGEGSGTVTVTVEKNIFLTGRSATVEFIASIDEALSATLAITQELAPASHESDSLALVAIYNASKGAEWAKNKWDLTKPISEWNGVTLTEGRVTALKLTTASTITEDWVLPEEVGMLSEITDLRVNGNKLTGAIPESVFELPKLAKLYFQNNNLTGSLSANLGKLTELTEFYIDRNVNLGGSIPASIGQLTKLKSINIAKTGIGGAIPAELVNCTALTNFMAYENKLSGEIPDFWDKLPNVGVVQLYGNPDITGPIPATLGTLKKATGIQLKQCNLTGNIPASFGGLEKCSSLQLNGNKLSGVVPAEVQAHPKWLPDTGWKYEVNILPQQDGYGLLLSYSHQTDSLALVAIYNAANGATWKEERRWDLSKPIDQWDGVKLTDGRVTTLAITASGVITSAWTMPKEVGNLSELTVLKFNQCKLTGELPEEVFNLTKLTDLYFQSNDLTGTFSDKYTQLTSLKNLYINNNKNLGGSLPASIGQLTKLESINIAQTKFSGTIPAELALCTSLKNIMAWSNNLSGEIPDFWDKLPNVGVIQFYGNPDITGPIPSTMGTLKKATGIQLKECNLTGNIPASFGGLEKCGNLQLNGNKLSGVVPAEVQAHPKWQATSGWKYETNILPQQDGYGLTTE